MESRADILNKVIEVVTEVTLADKDTVTEQSQLFDDLGVESIDFIDIIYNLESEFDLEISNEAIFTDRDFFSSEKGNWSNPTLTEAGKDAIKQFAYLNMAKAMGPDPQTYLYSIEMLVDFIAHKKAQT